MVEKRERTRYFDSETATTFFSLTFRLEAEEDGDNNDDDDNDDNDNDDNDDESENRMRMMRLQNGDNKSRPQSVRCGAVRWWHFNERVITIG